MEDASSFIWENYDSDVKLLLDFKEMSVHQKYDDYFIIEVYKYLNHSSRDVMNDVLWLRRNVYNLRNFCAFEYQNLLTKT